MIIEHGISGFDFVRAMLADGFSMVGTTMGHVLIEKGHLELLVPQHDLLSEDKLLEFLQQAEMRPLRFVVLVSQLAGDDDGDERPRFTAFNGGRDRAHADAMCEVAESRLPFPQAEDSVAFRARGQR